VRVIEAANTLLLSSIFTAICICSIPVFGAEQAEQPRKIMLASTIGPIDAGIVEALEEAFMKKTGIIIQPTGAGTSQALTTAKTGKCTTSYSFMPAHLKRNL